METGLKQAITVTATSGLTEDEIRRMVEESRDYLLDQKQNEEFEGKKQAAEKLIEEIEGLFGRVEQAIAGSDFGQDAIKKAHNVIERARNGIANRDDKAVVDSTEALNRTLNMFKGVVAKTRVG
jgi:molecular chaperone DnaK